MMTLKATTLLSISTVTTLPLRIVAFSAPREVARWTVGRVHRKAAWSQERQT